MDVKKLFTLKDSLESFGADFRKHATEIAQLREERAELARARPTRDEVKAMLTQWAARRSSDYLERLQFNLGDLLKDHEVLGNAAQIEQRVSLFGKSRVLGGLGMFPGPELEDMAICFLLGPQLVKALHAAVDAMPWPANSMSAADRTRRIEAIDKKLARMTKEHDELVVQARAYGVDVENLPPSDTALA